MLTKMGHSASSKNIVCNFISSLPCLTYKKTFTSYLRFYRTLGVYLSLLIFYKILAIRCKKNLFLSSIIYVVMSSELYDQFLKTNRIDLDNF